MIKHRIAFIAALVKLLPEYTRKTHFRHLPEATAVQCSLY